MAHAQSAGHATGSVVEDNIAHRKQPLPLLTLGALGVVYGDIGTSPIYAFREAMAHAGSSHKDEILGLLSLIVWALTLTVTIKYIFFVTRADNKGEGGTLSLVALARAGLERGGGWIAVLGVIGAALFFGDAIITPAVSVLSAVEGLKLVSPALDRFIVPITLAILAVLFLVQRFGTAKVSTVFGPVMVVWFLTLGISGLSHVFEDWAVFGALNPLYGFFFLTNHPTLAASVIGTIFLAVTGAEALYVDLGHFGRRPIVIAWFSLVFPCLLLNYFGQASYVLAHGIGNIENPFFEMQPDWARMPFIALSTMATVIASQAVISGLYSLTQQAIALSMLPRMVVLHTSETQSGQIYMPQINNMLFFFVMLLVIAFQSSANLSAAYGIAVSGVMLVTTTLLVVVMWRRWKWHPALICLVMVPFGIIDTAFFASNVSKIALGGWVPALVAAVVAVVMGVWMKTGRRLAEKVRRDEVPLEFLVQNLTKKMPTIVPGTAVFLTADSEGAPTALLHSLKHYKVLHEKNVILTVKTSETPMMPDDEKVRIDAYNELFSRVVITFGYMETPNIPKALGLARKLGWKFDIMSTSFFLSRRTLKHSPKHGLLRYWQDKLFMALTKNASDATEYFHIPTGRVVEIGTQVTL